MLRLDRRTLAQLFQGNQQAIATFESVLKDVGTGLPDTIEEAHMLAGQALAAAQGALTMLALFAQELERIEAMPRSHLGTIGAQNHDSVDIDGGTVDGTPIGLAAAAAAKFTTVRASGQITSTLPAGTPPLVVSSSALVDNLYVARAAQADHAEESDHASAADVADALSSPSSFPDPATDLPTVIALANALRAANIAKGV